MNLTKLKYYPEFAEGSPIYNWNTYFYGDLAKDQKSSDYDDTKENLDQVMQIIHI